MEFLFLPGLGPMVAREVRDRLPDAGPVREVPGQSDSLVADYRGDWARLLDLRTIVAPFLLLSFPVPRPRSLTSGEFFPQIMDAVRLVQRINPETPRTFRIDAAGSDSGVRSEVRVGAHFPVVVHTEGNDVFVRSQKAIASDGTDSLGGLSAQHHLNLLRNN